MQGRPVHVHTAAEFEEALALRYEVFCDEQGVPREIERDDEDDLALHVVVRDAAGRVCATGRALRMRPDESQVALGAPSRDGDLARIGRMAVRRDARGTGVGSLVLVALEDAARAAGLTAAVLHAQRHAVPFYARHGYRESGAPYDEAGIPHVNMTKAL